MALAGIDQRIVSLTIVVGTVASNTTIPASVGGKWPIRDRPLHYSTHVNCEKKHKPLKLMLSGLVSLAYSYPMRKDQPRKYLRPR